MPKQYQNNYYRGRGRGSRFNRRGGYSTPRNERAGQSPANNNIPIPNVFNQDQLIKMQQSEKTRKEDKASYTSKPDAVVDVTNKTWEDLDRELEWINDHIDDEDNTYAEEVDHDRTVFTDAWDAQPIIDFATAVYRTAAIGTVITTLHNMDIVGFIGYTCALAETYLASNEAIIGVNGWTRAMVTEAKSILQRTAIPELIALMFLQLRPRQLPDGTRFVLLPHTFDPAVGAAPNQITWNGAHDVNLTLHQHVFLVQTVGQAVGAANNINVAFNTRTNWMKRLIDEAERAQGQQYYERNDLNNFSHGSRAIEQMFETSNRTHTLFNHNNNIRYDTFKWDVWFNYDYTSFTNKNVRRKYIGFGNNSCYKVIKCRELPITVITANHVIMAESRRSKERWMPWFLTPTIAARDQFVGAIQGQVNTCVVNYGRAQDGHNLPGVARGMRCYNLAIGHGDAMIRDTLA